MPRFLAIPAINPSRYCFWSSVKLGFSDIQPDTRDDYFAALQQSSCQLPGDVSAKSACGCGPSREGPSEPSRVPDLLSPCNSRRSACGVNCSAQRKAGLS